MTGQLFAQPIHEALDIIVELDLGQVCVARERMPHIRKYRVIESGAGSKAVRERLTTIVYRSFTMTLRVSVRPPMRSCRARAEIRIGDRDGGDIFIFMFGGVAVLRIFGVTICALTSQGVPIFLPT